MTNIFDEKLVAEKIINNGFKNNNPNKYEMILIAKYFRWIIGHGKAKTKSKLIKFCIENNSDFNIITNARLVKDVVKIAERDTFKEVYPVQITKDELDKIESIRNFSYQKVLFVALVFAKALKFTFTKTKPKQSDKTHFGYYISNNLLSKIKAVSKTRISKIDFLYIFNYFYDEGFIEPTYYNSIRILFAEDKGIPEIKIDDFSRILEYYIEYRGGEIFYCEECGSENKIEKNKRKFCDDCRAKRRKKQTRKHVAKHRISKK